MSKDKVPNNVIPFPIKRTRVGKKYRQEEIGRINELLRLCDEDMKTILEQIDQLQLELTSLTIEYEKLTDRLLELFKIEENEND